MSGGAEAVHGDGFLAGPGLLARFPFDVVKIDMSLLRGLNTDERRRGIVAAIAGIGKALGARVEAEGVETDAERSALQDLGITLFQGYLFAKPGFETLPRLDL